MELLDRERDSRTASMIRELRTRFENLEPRTRFFDQPIDLLRGGTVRMRTARVASCGRCRSNGDIDIQARRGYVTYHRSVEAVPEITGEDTA